MLRPDQTHGAKAETQRQVGIPDLTAGKGTHGAPTPLPTCQDKAAPLAPPTGRIHARGAPVHSPRACGQPGGPGCADVPLSGGLVQPLQPPPAGTNFCFESGLA